jgi:S-adenosylmethionine:tRNA ribosyltransferase-isomerase
MAELKASDFDYELPAELIAQQPLPGRSQSRMLVLDRSADGLVHATVAELPRFLRRGDLLVVNDTRVFPARLYGRRDDTGGRVELLLVEEHPDGTWTSLFKASGRPRAGLAFSLAEGRLRGEILAVDEGGMVRLRLLAGGPVRDVLELVGAIPLPPYIRREGEGTAEREIDRERYQTVFAEKWGAVAAPTAGLHFTPELLDELGRAGVGRAAVTLHVGPGTFKPVKVDEVRDHVMDEERYLVPPESASAINAARAAGGRIVAVGTTTVRTLETVAAPGGHVPAGEGRSGIFIYPPYRFKAVDALLTNFHLPRSTLLMLVSAFAGRERVMAAYRAAVEHHYRFYSYGDCMLIL